MSELYNLGADIGALASELIYETPAGSVTIGSALADVALIFQRFDSFPRREQLEPAINELRGAMGQICYNGSAATDTAGGFVGNNVYQNLGYLSPDVNQWTGKAQKAYNDNFAVPLPFVADAQFIAASAVLAAFETEAQLWERVQVDIRDIGEKTRSALQEIKDKDGATFTFITTAVAAAVAVFVTASTGGAALPVTLTILAGIGTSSADGASVPHGTEEPETVMNAMYEQIGALEKAIVDHEQGIADTLDAITTQLKSSYTRSLFPHGGPTFHLSEALLGQGLGPLGHYNG